MPFDGLVAKPRFSILRWLFRSAAPQDNGVVQEITRQQTVLEKLGLTPVPDSVLEAHKTVVAVDFRRNNPRYHDSSSMFRWFEYYQANTTMIAQPVLDTGPTAERFSNDVLAAVRGLGNQGAGARVVPKKVYAIADAVTRRATKLGIETERVAGFFYLDPYVSLVYRENGEIKRACLAIWDGHTVLHIAELR